MATDLTLDCQTKSQYRYVESFLRGRWCSDPLDKATAFSEPLNFERTAVPGCHAAAANWHRVARLRPRRVHPSCGAQSPVVGFFAFGTRDLRVADRILGCCRGLVAAVRPRGKTLLVAPLRFGRSPPGGDGGFHRGQNRAPPEWSRRQEDLLKTVRKLCSFTF